MKHCSATTSLHTTTRAIESPVLPTQVLATVALTTLWGAIAAPPVAAHGREPVVGQVAFNPVDRDHFVLRGTWALLTTHDDGASFTWTCATAAGFDRLSEDPAMAITGSARVHLGTFDGLRRSSTLACDYADANPPAWGSYTIDVQNDPFDDRALWVAMSPGDAPNTLLHSSDEGESFEVLSSFEPGLLLERVRAAPNAAMRLYASGAIPRAGDEPRRAYVFASSDGGVNFSRTEVALLEGERNLHVLAVDPLDADRALVRVTRAVTDETPERLLLTEDGGETFRTVLETLEIVGVAWAHDGGSVWAGSWDGGLHRSDDDGVTWTTIDADLRVRCLAEREAQDGGRELFVCVDEFTNDYAVGRSYDDGETIEPLWGFADVTNDTGCTGCTVVGAVCPAYWPDVLYDIATIGVEDGGLPPGPADVGPVSCGEAGVYFDTGTRADAAMVTTTPSGCGCRVGTRAAPFGPLALTGSLSGAALLWQRRRSRRV